MKKKLLLALTLVAVFVCLFAVAVSAAQIAGYQQYEVELLDGSKITVYESANWDQWQGRLNLTDATYTEAPLDTEKTYPLLDWSQVVVVDFTNAHRKQLNSKTGEYEVKYGTNDGYSMHLTTNGFTAANATNLKTLKTGAATVMLGGSNIGALPALEEVICGEKLKNIGWNALQASKTLKTVDFSACTNFTTFGQQAFIGCTVLETITLPNTITSMGDSVFQNCTSLKTVNWPTSMTTIPNSTFNGCTSLEFEIPSNITKIGSSAFRNCDAFTVVTVPASVATIDGFAFAECDNLTTVDFADGSVLSNKLVGIALSCPKLTSFEIPAGVTSLGYDNFWHCTSLKEIDISGITEITGGNNFADTAITKLVFSNNLTTLASGNINDKVEEIRFGANIVSIGSGAFNVKTLKRVYLSSTLETIGSNILGWSNPADSSMNITFIYTGTKAEAEALQTYYREWTLANNPGHAPNSSKFYDAVLVSADEYDVTQEPSGFHLVYGYNSCEAFYDGEHSISTEAVDKFEGEAYVTRYITVCECTRGCGEDAVSEICGPLFINKGYSVYEENGNGNITFGIYTDEKNIEAYEAHTGSKVSFGFVVGKENSALDGDIFDENGACLVSGAICTDFATIDFKSFSIYNLKLSGIATDSNKAQNMYCGVYVIDGTSVSYIGDSVTTKAVAISYNSLSESKKEEQ